ncbi:MAG: MBL fold metallo-hydrolase [Alphaproteobacteria bacterium]|nr:MBL fold metallo-hydrolase [Alphaproteobacteria bacterium]
MQNLKKPNFEIIRMPPENTQSVLLTVGDSCVIFDPWGRSEDWIRILDERKLKLQSIYATHGHPDHISAAPSLARHYNVPWYLHSGDFRLVGWGNGLLEYFGLPKISLSDIRPTTLDLSPTVVLPDVKMNIVETPGHTPGGVAYYFPDEKIMLIGDTLFQESYGRCDLPGGDEKMLFQSIANIYNMNLPGETMVVHGHGMDTTIDWLRKNNPYFHN